jgi:hypothetical protein
MKTIPEKPEAYRLWQAQSGGHIGKWHFYDAFGNLVGPFFKYSDAFVERLARAEKERDR